MDNNTKILKKKERRMYKIIKIQEEQLKINIEYMERLMNELGAQTNEY